MQLPEIDGADGVGYGVDYPIFWIAAFTGGDSAQPRQFAAVRAEQAT
jgi:hypothetical protein